MGLDNGITISHYSDEAKADIPAGWFYHNGKYVEAIYMRKWWGVRNDIVSMLSKNYIDVDEGTTELTISDLKNIQSILIDWCDEEKWTNDGGSPVWFWADTMAEQIGVMVSAINKLIHLKEKYPEIIIEFFDSY